MTLGGVVVKALRYYSDGLEIDSRWSHWGFFSVVTDRTTCPGVDKSLKMSTRDFSLGEGGRCVRLTTYHPHNAKR